MPRVDLREAFRVLRGFTLGLALGAALIAATRDGTPRT